MNIIWQKVDLSKVDSLVAGAIRAQGKANQSIQIAAVAVLAHAAKHGDYSKASTLVDGLQGAFRASLVEWFVKFGGLTVAGGKFAGWSGADHIRSVFDEAKTTAWYQVKKEAPYKGYDLDQDIRGVLDRARKAVQKAANDPEIAKLVVVRDEQMEALKAALAA